MATLCLNMEKHKGLGPSSFQETACSVQRVKRSLSVTAASCVLWAHNLASGYRIPEHPVGCRAPPMGSSQETKHRTVRPSFFPYPVIPLTGNPRDQRHIKPITFRYWL